MFWELSSYRFVSAVKVMPWEDSAETGKDETNASKDLAR
jgi:hypothetical protein